MSTSLTTAIAPAQRPSRGPLERLLAFFSSIWLGVVLLALLFVYSAVGSAGVLIPRGLALGSEDNWVQYHVRQWRGLEMTEFEWFHWWPFNVLIALICTNIVVATLRRIPFSVVNYGVWMIHSGILVLALGSFYYFGTKHEGDAPVTRRSVRIEVPGQEPASLVALPGNRTQVGQWQLAVLAADPAWEVLSGEDAGARTYKVSVQVRGPQQSFIRELLAGYAQYTEDVLESGDPHQPFQRARKLLGRPLVDETISLSLALEPQASFHEMNSWAIHLRAPGGTWVQRPIDGLPRYNDSIGASDEVWLGEDLPLDPLDIEVPAVDPGDPLGDVPVRVRSYLRYASMQTRRAPGGTTLEPAVSLRVQEPGGGPPLDLQLVAFEPGNNRVAIGSRRLRFEWADSPRAIEAWRERVQPALLISGEGDADARVRPIVATDPAAPWQDIPGTTHRYRVLRHEDGLQLSEGEVISLALVEVQSPQRSFVRWVFDDAARPNRDFAPGAGGAIHGEEIERDDTVRMVYRPAVADTLIVAGPAPEDLLLIVAGAGETSVEPIAEGAERVLPDGTRLQLQRYAAHTVAHTRPAIVPRSQRDRDADVFFSMIRVQVPGSAAGAPTWLPYSHYVYERADEAIWRYPFAPQTVHLADGREIEIAFSRRRRPLPAPVALEDFTIVEHVGGFTGATLSIRDWISRVRFMEQDGTWGEERSVQVNQPIEHGGYWYYQAQWDPPVPQRGWAGMNYTVLGVGNRHGVNIMLAGCCISVAGMIYAFYVKPVIKRRRRLAAAAAAGSAGPAPRALPARPRPALESVGEGMGGTKAQRHEGTKGTGGWAGMLVLALAVLFAWPRGAAARQDPIASVDLLQLGQVAVHDEGRLKSFDSFASATMQMVSGPHRIDGQPAVFTYLDLILRPQRYQDRPLIYVRNKPIRADIIEARRQAPAGSSGDFDAWAADFLERGLISRQMLLEPAVGERLAELGRDLVTTARFVQMIETALAVSEPRPLLRNWRLIPPPQGDVHTPWLSLMDVMGIEGDGPRGGLEQAMSAAILRRWEDLVNAWKGGDAAAATVAADGLAAVLPAVNSGLYPQRNRLAWESWYFHMKNLTWVWLVYALALVPLLLSLVFRWPAARWMGLGLFIAAFALQTFTLCLRWYVAQRWPNTNMFEAVTTSTWFGGAAAVILEIAARRTPMRGVFAIASAVASMLAFMGAHYQPLILDPNLSNRMPVLHDVWLYIHTNVIIFSYCLIFMAAVSALLYLVWRVLGLARGFGGRHDFARVGGAGSLLAGAPGGAAAAAGPRPSFGQVLDGTTMVLMELSFIMLWAGLVMGAIWADHSWGRPWGWDPKEVFALNTFIVFAILVHGRLKVADKGLWTACIALLGAAVMLFNWFTINFVITGLHSYA